MCWSCEKNTASPPGSQQANAPRFATRIWLSGGDHVAGQDDLDATISGATLGRVVGVDWPRRPQAFDIDGRCLHALRDQVVAYRDGAIVRQPAIELVAA